MFGPYPYMNGQQIIRVNGEPGAQAYQMMPNSSALLLDESAPRLFLAQTDGAGYKTINAYKLEPYKAEKAPDMGDLIKRIEKLERTVNEKPNSTNVKRKTDAERNAAED